MNITGNNQHGMTLAELRGQLSLGRDMLKQAGAFHLADASFPVEPTHRRKSWRCLPMTRIGLMLTGEHEVAYVHKATTVECRMVPGDMWCFPVGTHDDEMFLHPGRYISAVFFEDYTRIVVVSCPGPSEAYPAPSWFHWPGERPEEIQAVLSALHRGFAYASAEQISVHLCRALWLLLGEWAQRGGDESGVRSQGKARTTWAEVKRIMEENYHRPMNRQTVADNLQLHPNRISELCRQFGGDTFQHLLEQRRMAQARQFLESSHTKIEAIAVMCGFSGAAYFTRAFRRSTGMSPGEWRRKKRKSGRASEVWA
ncbi:MAG: AraC family transcriptional regulator [Opitutaceae bacterium]|jgi:AraC-like DNA-binding protein